MDFWKTHKLIGKIERIEEQSQTVIKPIVSISSESFSSSDIDNKIKQEQTIASTTRKLPEEQLLNEVHFKSNQKSYLSVSQQQKPKDYVVLSREQKFEKLLENDVVDLNALCELSWNGIPQKYRHIVWKLLLGYLPPHRERREETLKRKRAEYRTSISTIFNTEKTEDDEKTLNQINKDLPRMYPNIPILHHEKMTELHRRVLHVWSVRHMAAAYVQGTAEVLAAVVLVAGSGVMGIDLSSMKQLEHASMPEIDDETLFAIEADSFWCFTRILDGIQDNYVFSQPGIQRTLFKIQELVQKIDKPLYDHLEEEGIPFVQFAFRWVNCILTREFKVTLIVRMWDTYLSEGGNGTQGFAVLNTYVCVALLTTFRKQILELKNTQLLLFLQALPTSDWTERDIEMLLSQAYIYQTQYQGALNHLK